MCLASLQRLVDRIQGRRTKRLQRRLRFWPCLQALEERILPTTIRWMGASADWHADANNWTVDGTGEHRFPIASDDVIIDVANAIVSHATSADTVNSLSVSNGTFNLSGGTLAITGTLGGSSTFNLSGNGILANASASLTIHALDGTLSSVTVNGALDVSNGRVTVINRLTLNGTAQVGNTDGTTFGQLSFSGTQTVSGSGSLTFGGRFGNFIFFLGGGLPTLAVPVRGGSGTMSGSFVNQSTISCDSPGGRYVLGGDFTNWRNEGTIQVSNGGTLDLAGSWTNTAGHTIATTGATLDLGVSGLDAWSNAGTISATNSTVNLGGVFTLATLGTFNRNGGTVNLTGTLNNTDTTLTLNANTGDWNLSQGQVNGGTVTEAGGRLLFVSVNFGTLNAVTFNGDMDLATGSTNRVMVTGGLTLNGTAFVGNGPDRLGQLSFNGTQTLGGSGNLTFGATTFGNAAMFVGSGVLTLAIPVHGGNGSISGGTFVNRSTISCDGPGGRLTLSGTNWRNDGTIEVSNGGTANIGGNGGSWTNAGTISATNATVNLGGVFTVAGLGTFNRSSGTVNLTGTLNNTGTTLALNDTTGDWHLNGGMVNGGTVTESGSARLQFTNATNTLNAVTFNSDMDLTGDVAAGLPSRVEVTGGLTLNAIMHLGSLDAHFSGIVTFFGSPVLGGSGTVVFSGADRNQLGGQFTVGPGIMIRGENGTISGPFTNQGTISEDVPGGTIWIDGTNWTNSGTIQAMNGEATHRAQVLFRTNPANYVNGTLNGGTWQAFANSSIQFNNAGITADGANLVLDGTNAQLLRDDGHTSALAPLRAIAAGSLTLRHGSTLTTSGDLENDGTLVLGNTLTVNGNYTQGPNARLTIEIAGAPDSGAFGRLVGGTFRVDGILQSTLANPNFGPTSGQMFPVLTFGTLQGSFRDVRLPHLGRQPAFDFAVTANNLFLTASVSPVDLAVDTITIPPTAVPGQPVTVRYTVQNLSTAATSAGWVDSIYVSETDQLGSSAVLFDRVQHVGGVAGLSSYSESSTQPFPRPPSPANVYRIIVVADSQGLVPDYNRANNTRASTDLVAVGIPTLRLDVPLQDNIASGQDRYYRLDVPQATQVRLSADFSLDHQAELYVRYGDLPSRSTYDHTVSNLSDLHPNLVLNGRAGTYYILVHGREGAVQALPFQLTARTVTGLEVRTVSPNHGSNLGVVTAVVTGAHFSPNAVVSLASGGTERQARRVNWKDSGTLYATFDLTGLTAGTYDLRVVDHSQPVTLPGAFTVNTGALGHLEANISSPAFYRRARQTSVTVDYRNTGEADIPAPLLTISAQGARFLLPELGYFVDNSIQLLGINRDGPAGVLPPGAHGSITLGVGASFRTFLDYTLLLPAAPAAAVNWAALKDGLRPASIPVDAWDPIFANFTATVGNTFGQYQAVLDDDATYLSEVGMYTADAGRLFSFALRQADDLLPRPSLADAVDATAPQPGLDLEFSRVFHQPLDGRYRLGRLGRGWTDNWDISASADSAGNVTIQENGGFRFFQRLPDGTYRTAPGDHGVLTLQGGAYQLREKDGTLFVFGTDGKLSFQQDPHGNRITLGYTGSQLTSLSHSSGAHFLLHYNAQGRIDQLTDQAGRITTYNYDASGEQLRSVVGPNGTTAYDYWTDASDPARLHALRSIGHPDNTHVFFDYDDRGRLRGESRDGGLEPLRYTYNQPGGVTVTDAAQAATTLLFNQDSLLAQTRDPLGRIQVLTYDGDNNLVQATSPDGTTMTFGYDNRGNLTSSVDALGQENDMTYDPTFNRLTSLTDPRANITRYRYDDQANLRAITYPDGNAEQFTYDPLGDLTDTLNRRGGPIHYTPDPAGTGLIVRKDYADHSHIDFAYDSRGHVRTATDSTGTTTLDWDPTADRLNRITYPGGRFLQFFYERGGDVRTRMVDQSGFTVKYDYYDDGKLKELRDGQDNLIVHYDYYDNGLLHFKRMGNGTFTEYQYDPAGQLLHLINSAPGGAVNSRFDYSYDDNGRRTSMTTLDDHWDYGYDAIGQLTSVRSQSGRTIEYHYDAAGNRTFVIDNGVRTDYVTNNLDQYTSIGMVGYVYDPDGNLIVKRDGSQVSTYTYNDDNQLLEAVTQDGTSTYEYDPFGKRSAATRNGQHTAYLLDPAGLGNVVGEYTGTGSLIAHYTYGFGLTSRIDASNGAAYYDFDAVGSTVGLTGPAGSYLNRYSYLPFGEELSRTEAIANPFTYVGEWGVITEANGLTFMRARYYSAANGRFMSLDPIGFVGGDTNLYRYVGNSPVDLNDPSGLFPPYLGRLMPGQPYELQGGKGIILLDENGVIHIWYEDANGDAYDKYQDWLLSEDEDSPGLAGTGNSTTAAGLAGTGNSTTAASLPGTGSSTTAASLPGTGSSTTAASLPGTGSSTTAPSGAGLGAGGSGVAPSVPPPANPGGQGPRGGSSSSRPAEAVDPNDLLGPAGFGPAAFIALSHGLGYTIRFENEAQANAPAQVVIVTEQLDPNLDWSTFQLGDFGFGNLVLHVPAGSIFYSTRIDVRATLHVFVDVTGTFDVTTGLARWVFNSLDPHTLDVPDDPLAGFLPPNQSAPEGEGFVSYTVSPRASLGTGTVIRARGTVIFDDNAPVDTPEWPNTIDALPPTSAVDPLPSVSQPTFIVSWSGTDDPGGSGIASFDVYVSADGGDFVPWLVGTTATASIFAGTAGHTYSFYSVAVDNVGNREPTPNLAQASTTTAEMAAGFRITVNAPSVTAGVPFSVTVTALDADGNVITDYVGVVHFSSSDLLAGLPDDYRFTADDGGVHTFDGLFLIRAGDQWLRVVDPDTSVGGYTVVTVLPAPTDHFRVTVVRGVVSGMPFDITVTALDPYGNVDVNYTGTVTFSSADQDPGVILPLDYTFTADDAGTHTFTDTGRGETTLITAGDQTITVTDGTISIDVLVTVDPAGGPDPHEGEGRAFPGAIASPLTAWPFLTREGFLPHPEPLSQTGAAASRRADRPVRVADEVFVMAQDGGSPTLGSRTAQAAIDHVFAATADEGGSLKLLGPDLMPNSQLLNGLGLIPDPGQLPLTVRDVAGEIRTVCLSADASVARRTCFPD
jgi:RHS repeat-associated protein